MVREYVGARYVPKFSDVNGGEWDPSYSYEALTIVKHGLDFYTSKKPVPVGIGILDQNYWISTGDYNGAISQLNDEVAILNGSTPESGTVIILGNSYVDRGCADYFASKFNEAKKYTRNSIGFAPYTGVTATYSDALTDAIDDTELDKSKVTTVLIYTGFAECIAYQENSTTFMTNFAACANDIVTRCGENFPNLQEIVVAYGATRNRHHSVDASNVVTSRWQMLWYIHAVLSEFLPKYKMRYLGWTGWSILMDASMFEADNIHPNANGAAVTGLSTWAGYKGTLEYPVYSEFDTLPLNGFPSGSTVNAAVSISPTGGQITLRPFSIKQGTVASGTHAKVLDLSQFKYMPIPRYTKVVGDAPLIYDSAGNKARCQVSMLIQGPDYDTQIQMKLYSNLVIPADYTDAAGWDGFTYLF